MSLQLFSVFILRKYYIFLFDYTSISILSSFIINLNIGIFSYKHKYNISIYIYVYNRLEFISLLQLNKLNNYWIINIIKLKSSLIINYGSTITDDPSCILSGLWWAGPGWLFLPTLGLALFANFGGIRFSI